MAGSGALGATWAAANAPWSSNAPAAGVATRSSIEHTAKPGVTATNAAPDGSARRSYSTSAPHLATSGWSSNNDQSASPARSSTRPWSTAGVGPAERLVAGLSEVAAATPDGLASHAAKHWTHSGLGGSFLMTHARAGTYRVVAAGTAGRHGWTLVRVHVGGSTATSIRVSGTTKATSAS